MNTFESAWLAPFLVVIVSLILGGLVAWWLQQAGKKCREDAEIMGDLQESLAHCLAQLSDLAAQKEMLTQAAYDQQKNEFEQRAAHLLQLQQTAFMAPAPKQQAALLSPKSRSPVVNFFYQRPQWRGALWGAGSVGLVVFLYSLVVSQQHVRESQPMVPQTGQADMPEMKNLLAELEKKPNDVDALLKLSHLLLRNQMLEEARTVNDRALQLAPDNIEAQTHAAVLQASTGDTQHAMALLTSLTQQHAEFAEAWFFRGMLAMQSGQQALMQDSFRHFVKLAPPGPQRDRIAAMINVAPNP